MRKAPNHRAMSCQAITGLLVAALCAPAAWAEKDACDASRIEKYTKKGSRPNYCKPADTACGPQVDKFSEIATAYVNELKASCAANGAALKVGGSAEGQQMERERAKALFKSAAEGNRKLSELAKEKAREAGKLLAKNFQDLQRNLPPSAMASHHDGMQKLANKVGQPEETIRESDVTGLETQVGSFRFGSELRKDLHEANHDFETAAGKIEDLYNRTDNPNGGGNTADDGKDTKKGGGLMDSMNPGALMGLASAGLGLASALKNNKKASDVSAPTDTTPPAVPAAAASLGEASKAPNSTPNMANETPKPEAPVTGSGGSPSFGGAPFGAESDVSSRSSRQTASSTPAPASASAGGLEASGGTGGHASETAAKDPGALAPKGLDDTGGFSAGGGGGGGGGLNFGSSSSTSSDSSHPEDPLKETLQDMAAAVDNGGGSAATAPDGAQAGPDEVETSNEFLFTRVRSAIQRSVKKGAVISGLTAKIR